MKSCYIAKNVSCLLQTYLRIKMLLSEIFLKENSFLPNNVVAYLREHCQPYMQAVNDDLSKFLYRGVSNNAISNAKRTEIDNVYITTGYYPNRIPTDTSASSHKLANDFFQKKFGVPFRNGIFTTGSLNDARYYGHEVVIIIPIGNFKFCWSKNTLDMVGILPGDGSIDDKAFLEKLDQTYQITNLPKAISSKHEVMLYCNECLMITIGQKSHQPSPKKEEDTFNDDDDWDY